MEEHLGWSDGFFSTQQGGVDGVHKQSTPRGRRKVAARWMKIVISLVMLSFLQDTAKRRKWRYRRRRGENMRGDGR